MNHLWYVRDGQVEEYSGQEVDWRDSAVVFAPSPEAALINVMKYRQGLAERVGLSWCGRDIEVIA